MEYHRYTPHEEIEILLEYRETGDVEVRDKLILSYIPAVRNIAGKIRRDLGFNGIQIDDLVADGIIGLHYAFDNFDFNAGCQLNTYVFMVVRHRILRSEFLQGVVHLPYAKRFIDRPILTEIKDIYEVRDFAEQVNFEIDFRDAFQTLDNLEQFIIEEYYLEGKSHRIIGLELGYSHTWVRKIKVAALNKLKHYLEGK